MLRQLSPPSRQFAERTGGEWQTVPNLKGIRAQPTRTGARSISCWGTFRQKSSGRDGRCVNNPRDESRQTPASAGATISTIPRKRP
jgi:hypothetical protein